MKNTITAAFLILALNAFSQTEPVIQDEPVTYQEEPVYSRENTFNELSIGALNLVAFGAIDVAYERILTPNTSWAVETFFLALNKKNEDLSEAYSKDFSLTGKVKYFFSERAAWGFYVNGLTMISTGKYVPEDNRDFNQDVNFQTLAEEKYTDLALGFGLGGKFVAKQGFFVDLSTGIGRNLFSSNSPTIIGQFNANLGFRF